MAFSSLPIASKACRAVGLVARRFCKSSVEDVFPKSSVWREIDKDSLPALPKLDDDLLHLLEEQSLVRFDDKAALWHLQKAIEYANQLHAVDTENIEPLYTLLEDEALYLRADDCPSEMIERTELLSNAAVSCEGYFVAPPGNVPLEKSDVQATFEQSVTEEVRNDRE
ncbi:putative aspartyl/glutamyl-tRNA(Asn/Gln) amidotransferase, C subunit [Trichuris suis]|nr:putative aspartyl/glutamyl-tRNA(Asn/Gln) amidotransferase, C subunit [Trichuris suis]